MKMRRKEIEDFMPKDSKMKKDTIWKNLFPMKPWDEASKEELDFVADMERFINDMSENESFNQKIYEIKMSDCSSQEKNK